jgi:hypothetical protein
MSTRARTDKGITLARGSPALSGDAHRHLAELYRRLADTHEEIALVLDEATSGPANDTACRRRARGPRIPRIEISDTDRKAAEKAAARKGMLGP